VQTLSLQNRRLSGLMQPSHKYASSQFTMFIVTYLIVMCSDVLYVFHGSVCCVQPKLGSRVLIYIGRRIS